MVIRRSNERGQGDHGWLKSKHTFSFADYQDPAHMGYRALRVINEDRVSPGQGFGTHGHRDMEIVTYVVEGQLAHKDDTGRSEVLGPREIQRMSAGTGVRHSEYNASKETAVHFLQISIIPETLGVAPGYEQKAIRPTYGKLTLIGSREGGEGAVVIHQDVKLYAGLFGGGETTTFEVGNGRHAWVQVVRGTIELGGQRLARGDAAAIDDPGPLTITGVADAEVLVFDLA